MDIKLPAQLDLAALPVLKEEFVSAALTATSLVVDGANVERAGTPAVQLLLAAAKAFSSEGRSFRLEAPSETLTSAFEDLGLSTELSQWSAA